ELCGSGVIDGEGVVRAERRAQRVRIGSGGGPRPQGHVVLDHGQLRVEDGQGGQAGQDLRGAAVGLEDLTADPHRDMPAPGRDRVTVTYPRAGGCEEAGVDDGLVLALVAVPGE